MRFRFTVFRTCSYIDKEVVVFQTTGTGSRIRPTSVAMFAIAIVNRFATALRHGAISNKPVSRDL